MDDEIRFLRAKRRGRPDDPPKPRPGQESVWDYPRPPRIEPCGQRIRVIHAGRVVADTRAAHRVLETASPPTYYLPADDCERQLLRPSAARTICEWKGQAAYWDLAVGGTLVSNAAWSYATPWQGFEAIAGALAFFAGRVDECWVGEDRVIAQPGDFYGGWVTPQIVGPFKGEPGTEGW